ncbi:expressed unknown protein [Seminavis robusta]|uniref:Rieske domain-containing protein n=1 Tax=Seminavis robusta TaxID=568900 RepID=A0A9N8F4D2_9STRA|nr:expressed unknown protein [Seminavis robusta]|eukprot:Sro2925_g340380.2  (451) ;mRNA; f:7737-9089
MKPLLFFLSSCVFGPAFSFQLQPSVGVGVTRNHGARRTILKTTQNDASLEDVLVSESASQSTTSNGITATLFPATRATPSSSQRPLSNRQQLDEQYPQFPRTWVPIASTLELDHTRPNRLEFLDQSYVAYRNPRTSNNDQQQWVVMDNTCPHRLAPLSEGRVEPETGRLQCSYHGWTFEADGSCQRIPQVVPSVEQSAMANPRSCLPSYSTMLDARTGVLWVWPWQQDPLEFVGDEWRHPEGFMEGLILDPSIQNATEAGIMTYTRDQPYGWDTLVENLIDPAHIPFAHHGMQGSRSDAIPINMTSATNLGEAGFAFEWQDRTMGMMRTGEGKFRAPFLVNYNATFASPTGEAKPFRLSALCIPTRPGWSRVMVFSIPTTSAAAKDNTSTNNRIKTFKLGPIMAQLFKRLPTWGSHLLSNKFFDSDLAFLHYQEQLRFDDESANSNLRAS